MSPLSDVSVEELTERICRMTEEAKELHDRLLDVCMTMLTLSFIASRIVVSPWLVIEVKLRTIEAVIPCLDAAVPIRAYLNDLQEACSSNADVDTVFGVITSIVFACRRAVPVLNDRYDEPQARLGGFYQ